MHSYQECTSCILSFAMWLGCMEWQRGGSVSIGGYVQAECRVAHDQPFNIITRVSIRSNREVFIIALLS